MSPHACAGRQSQDTASECGPAQPHQDGTTHLGRAPPPPRAHHRRPPLVRDAKARLPVFDQAIAALVEDIYDRGLDKKVLLIVAGEFGRTPRINPQKGTSSKVVQPG